jgi:membrane carboxypeptidase/penicillin-binding protein
MQKVLEGKSPVNFPVPEKIKFANVDVQTGYLAQEFSPGTIRVAVKEDVNLSLPPVLSNDPEKDETEFLPDPVAINKPQNSIIPNNKNVVPDP